MIEANTTLHRGYDKRTAQEPRVALVYGDYPPKPAGQADGGAEFVKQLGEGLVRRGFGVTAIVSRRAGRETPYEDHGVKIAPIIGDWRLRAARAELRRIRDVLRAEGAEIMHLVYPDPYLRYGSDSYHLPFALKASGLPLLVTFFGFGVTSSGPITRLGLMGLFATADAFVITDADLLRRFQRRLPWWRRKASGGFVGSIADEHGPRWSQASLAKRRSGLGLPNDHHLIGFFGFWGPGKGLEDLIDAVAQLRRAGDRAKLVIIGGRESEHRTAFEEGIVDKIKEAGLEQAVILSGHLSADEVSTYLVAMDVCVLPFKANPLGRSSLALALTLGIPTAVTRPVGDEALLEGLPLLDETDAVHIASAIQNVLGSPSEQVRISEAAFAAASHWSWDSIVEQYAGMYRQLRARAAR